MAIFLTTMHVAACVFLVAVVLLQHGKGADIGAAFGSGASSTVFGSRGAGNFLTKLTTGAVIVFMITSISFSYLGAPRSVTDLIENEPAPAAPPAGAIETPDAILPDASPIPGGDDADVPSGFEAIPAPETGTQSE